MRIPRPLILLLLVVLAIGCSTEERRRELVEEATTEEEPRERIEAVEELAQMEGDLVREEIESILVNDPNPSVRGSAAHMLAERKATESVPTLIKAFQDEADPVIRSKILDALRQLGGLDRPPVRELLITALVEDQHPLVRTRCAQMIHRTRYESAVPVLVRALDDYAPTVRISAYRALQAITGLQDVPPVRAAWAKALGERAAEPEKKPQAEPEK